MASHTDIAINNVLRLMTANEINGNLLITYSKKKGWMMMVVKEDRLTDEVLNGNTILAGTASGRGTFSAAAKELSEVFDATVHA
jgi:hypothetical protein